MSKNLRALITGCNGLLGQNLVQTTPQNSIVMGVDIHPLNVTGLAHYQSLDITNLAAVSELIKSWRPDWIVNAAAFTDVDGAETQRELCYRVNVSAVENLVHVCSQIGARLAHVSTDYIFDGKEGPYREEDHPNPIGYYGRSKLAGENVLFGSDIHYAIARTMVLYGHGRDLRPNFVTWLIKKLQQGEPIRIVTDQIGNTTLADELAEGLWQIVQQNARGVYHIAGSELVDRYACAVKIAQVFDLDAGLITPVLTADLKQSAPRPMKSGLIIDKATRELGIIMSDVIGGLRRFKQQYPI